MLCRCVVLLCFILGMPMLHSYVAFAAITSIGVVGLYTSYLVRYLTGSMYSTCALCVATLSECVTLVH
jgi:hypothetical protein